MENKIKGYQEVREEAAMVAALGEESSKLFEWQDQQSWHNPEWSDPDKAARNLPPLHQAAYFGYQEDIIELIKAGADINARDKEGRTALEIAFDRKEGAATVVLLNNGADASIIDIDSLKESSEYKRILSELSDEKMLSHAASMGYTEVLPELLEKGVDVNVQNSILQTPLEAARYYGHEEFAKILVENGAIDQETIREGIKNIPDDEEMVAAMDLEDRQLEAYQEYINGGYHTQEWEDAQIAAFEEKLKEREATFPLHYAAESGYIEKAKQLIEKGVDLNVKDKDGNTALHVCLEKFKGGGHSKEMAELLLQAGARVDEKNDYGLTPLHFAAWGGEKEVVESLLKRGADVHARGVDGRTPLHAAVYAHTSKVVELLIKAGGDINAMDDNGKTPLNWANNRGQLTKRNAKYVKEMIVEYKRGF